MIGIPFTKDFFTDFIKVISILQHKVHPKTIVILLFDFINFIVLLNDSILHDDRSGTKILSFRDRVSGKYC